MSVLPLQGAAEGLPWSLVRDNQLRSLLEVGLDLALGRGFLSGGGVTQSAPNEITLASGSVVWTAGIAYTLPAAILRSGFADGTNYVWGLLTRTAATQSNKTDPDTYAFALTHVLNSPTPPSALHIPVKVLTVTAGTITGMSDPPDKWLKVGPQRGWRAVDLAGTGNYTLSAAELRSAVLELTGILTGNRSLIFPLESGRIYLARNGTTGGSFTVTAKISGGSGEVIPRGEWRFLYVGGGDVIVLDPADLGALAAGTDNTLADGVDFALGTGTGTKIGTATVQKLGFWNAAPVIQPAGAAQAAVTLGNTDGAIGGLTISNPPTQAEVQALRDAAETLADDVRALSALVHAMRTALVNSGNIKGAA